MKNKKNNLLKTFLILVLFTAGTIVPILIMGFNVNLVNQDLNYDDFNIDKIDDTLIKSSDTTKIDEKLTADGSWWNTTFSRRIGFKIENNLSFSRYEPVNVSLTFEANSFYKGTERLVRYYGGGSWSEPLPVQIQGEDATPYITSCNIIFMANVSADSNSTYFLYYHVNGVGIDTSYTYNTGFQSGISGNALTVRVTGGSTDVSDYKLILRQDVLQGVSTLIKGTDLDLGINYHSTLSIAPEIIAESDPLGSLVFSAHLDESSGTAVSAVDASGSLPDGEASTADGWEPSLGVTNGAYDFEQSLSRKITFYGELSAVGEPFHEDQAEWTMMCWIKPESLGSTTSTDEGTRNAFMSYAQGNKETFEIGIDSDGKIRVFINADGGKNSITFSPGGSTVSIGTWHFIAVRVKLDGTNAVGVCLDDTWEYSTAWDNYGSMSKQADKNVNIGWADSGTDVYFDGMMDEVQFYNARLAESTVQSYKYSSSISTLTTETINGLGTNEEGQVFSQYTVDWVTESNMVVRDTCTFYWDYNMWNIERVIYFSAEYDSLTTTMIPLNTYYDLSDVTSNHSGSYYLSDNVAYSNIDITTGLTEWSDYVVAYYEPNTNDDAFGIFVQDWTTSVGLSMNDFNGTVVVESNQMKMKAGINNDFDNSGGGYSNKKLTINFWEFVDSVFWSDYGGEIDNVRKYFENISIALRSPLNQFIYQNESLTYDIAVYITDHDDHIVDGVTVDLHDENGTIIRSTTTDSLGEASFLSVQNGSYSINVSYTDDDFNKTIAIADPITTSNLANDSNAENIFIANFSRVNMTSIVLNMTYVVNGIPEGPLTPARLNFTYDYDGSSAIKLSGYKTTNETGAVVFRWTNATASGSVTFSVWTFLGWQNYLYTPLDLNTAGDDTIELAFTSYYWHEVNASQTGGDTVTFNTSLTIHDVNFNYITEINVDLDDSFTIIINYSYVGSNGSYGPIVGVVSMNLKIGATMVNENPLLFTHNGSGIYILTMNTSELIEPGGEAWKAGINYVAEITADDVIENNSLEISLNRYETRISTNTTNAFADWYDLISFEITYEFNDSGTWTGITGATVSYYVVGYGDIFGSATPISGGTYKISLNTTKFPETDIYFIHVSVTKQNYQPLGIDQKVTILDISTKLNNTETTFQYESNVYLGETEIFILSYAESFNGIGIADSEIAKYSWWKFINDVKVDEDKDVALTDIGDGLYKLDFNTETLEVGKYVFEVEIKKTNYEIARASIDLYINKRDFSTNVLTFYSAISGAPGGLEIKICIEDAFSGDPITDITPGDMTVTFLGQTFIFEHIGAGCYRAIITNIPGDALVFPQLHDAEIRIERENYTTFEDTVTINVGLIEVWSGMPLFYFLIIIIGAIIVVSSLGAYRVIQVRRIPTFIKKSKNLIKAISSEGKISDSLMYPPKEAFIAKKFTDNWKIHDLSLSEIMGIKKGKKVKTISEEKLKDAKGGAA